MEVRLPLGEWVVHVDMLDLVQGVEAHLSYAARDHLT